MAKTARVDMTGMRGHEVSNLAAWGWEWTSEGSRWQLVGLRGVEGPPMLSIKSSGSRGWTTTKIHETWSTDGTRADFLRVVKDFLSDITTD